MALQNKKIARNGMPLVMRLIVNDIVRLKIDSILRTMRVVKINSAGQTFFADHFEANVDARNRKPDDLFSLISKSASSLKNANARKVTISAIGEVVDNGFQY